MNKFKLALLACFVVLFITSCDKDDDPMTTTCESTDMTYTANIKSLLDTTCATSGCHDANAVTSIGALDTYENAVAFVSFGRILGAINHNDGFSAMPKGGNKVDDCTIDQITNWVNNGTPE